MKNPEHRLTPLSKHEKQKIFSEERDCLKRQVIEEYIKRGLALFRRGSLMIGIDKEGNEHQIAEVSDQEQGDKDIIWKKSLEIIK